MSSRALREIVKGQKEYVFIDQATGEVTEQIRKSEYILKPGARYVKEFTQHPLFRRKMPHATRTLLSALAARLPYANNEPYIVLGKEMMEAIEATYGLSAASLKRGMKYLLDNGYLVRIGRGRYFLNPYLYGRGSASNILERQKEWDALLADAASSAAPGQDVSAENEKENSPA